MTRAEIIRQARETIAKYESRRGEVAHQLRQGFKEGVATMTALRLGEGAVAILAEVTEPDIVYQLNFPEQGQLADNVDSITLHAKTARGNQTFVAYLGSDSVPSVTYDETKARRIIDQLRDLDLIVVALIH